MPQGPRSHTPVEEADRCQPDCPVCLVFGSHEAIAEHTWTGRLITCSPVEGHEPPLGLLMARALYEESHVEGTKLVDPADLIRFAWRLKDDQWRGVSIAIPAQITVAAHDRYPLTLFDGLIVVTKGDGEIPARFREAVSQVFEHPELSRITDETLVVSNGQVPLSSDRTPRDEAVDSPYHTGARTDLG